MSNLSEPIVELLEARSWQAVASVLEAHSELRGADVELLLSAVAGLRGASDYQTCLVEDLRGLLFDSGPDPAAAARRRPGLHWAEARELFGSRMDRAMSLYEQYQTTADPDQLDQARRRWDALLTDPRLGSTPPGYRLLVSEGLAVVRLAEYAASGDLDVLDAGLDVLREALDTTAASSRLRPRRLTNYAAALLQRFHTTADAAADLTAALEASREALSAWTSSSVSPSASSSTLRCRPRGTRPSPTSCGPTWARAPRRRSSPTWSSAGTSR